MSLSYFHEEGANVLFGELERYSLAWIAQTNQVLIVLVLSKKLVGHVAPNNLQQIAILFQMLLNLVVQIVQSFFNLVFFGIKRF